MKELKELFTTIKQVLREPAKEDQKRLRKIFATLTALCISNVIVGILSLPFFIVGISGVFLATLALSVPKGIERAMQVDRLRKTLDKLQSNDNT